jgi:hypothetical protein
MYSSIKMSSTTLLYYRYSIFGSLDIRIVDCHMYPGLPCTPSLVLSYIPAEVSMQYNPSSYTNPTFLQLLHWEVILVYKQTLSVGVLFCKISTRPQSNAT